MGDPAFEVACNYVLGVAWNPERKYYAPGGFMTALIQAMLQADRVNLAQIGISYPNLALAVQMYKYVDDGLLGMQTYADKAIQRGQRNDVREVSDGGRGINAGGNEDRGSQDDLGTD